MSAIPARQQEDWGGGAAEWAGAPGSAICPGVRIMAEIRETLPQRDAK